MKLRTLFLFLIYTLLNSVISANLGTDSLLIELKSSPQNKEKILLLNKLSKTFIETNPDSALYYANSGLDLANEIEYSLGIAENAASIGDYYVIFDSLNIAKEYYILAGKYFELLNMQNDYAKVLMVLGNIFLAQNNYSEALLTYQKSQHICEASNLQSVLPNIYNNIGVVYLNLGESEKALKYFQEAYSGFKTLGLEEHLAQSVSNIARIYMDNENDSLAIEYYTEALKIFKHTGNRVEASYVFVELGAHQLNKGNYNKALEYYTDAYEEIQNQNEEYLGPRSRALVIILGSLGNAHYNLGNYTKAVDYLEKSLTLAYQNNYINRIESSAFLLSQIYEKMREFEKSLTYYKVYEQYGDTILNESSIKRITQLEMQFEFDKEIKERELNNTRKEAAQQRKEFLYLLIIGLGIFVSIIGFLLYANQRNKTSKIELKRKNLNLEHEKLQQELEHRNKELATNVMYLLSKNEFITTTAEKLTKAKMGFKKENQKIIQDVIRDLLMNSSKDVWKEFEVRFQEVHTDFYNNLNTKFPDLTPNEKKICAFLRLNMSTKDISAITYQSVRSIDMARFRLRKKLDLDSDDNLVTYLTQI